MNYKVISIWLLLIYVMLYWIEIYEPVDTSLVTRKLDRDGFCCLFNDEYVKTQDIPCLTLQRDLLDKLPTGYTFIDYVYTIENTALSTFHRDVTSSKEIY